VRAEALVIQGKLAFAAGDGRRTGRVRRRRRVDPARANRWPMDPAAAALADVAGALAELETIDDDETKRRVSFARAQILRAAGRVAEARELLLELAYEIRPRGDVRGPVSLSSHERFEITIERCDADIDLGRTVGCDVELVKSLHPTAPVRARITAAGCARHACTDARSASSSSSSSRSSRPTRRRRFGSPELQWELARSGISWSSRTGALARTARDAFAGAA
jgi:hypothetical protein